MATATENNEYCFGGKGPMNHRTGHAMGDVAQQIGHFAWPNIDDDSLWDERIHPKEYEELGM